MKKNSSNAHTVQGVWGYEKLARSRDRLLASSISTVDSQDGSLQLSARQEFWIGLLKHNKASDCVGEFVKRRAGDPKAVQANPPLLPLPLSLRSLSPEAWKVVRFNPDHLALLDSEDLEALASLISSYGSRAVLLLFRAATLHPDLSVRKEAVRLIQEKALTGGQMPEATQKILFLAAFNLDLPDPSLRAMQVRHMSRFSEQFNAYSEYWLAVGMDQFNLGEVYRPVTQPILEAFQALELPKALTVLRGLPINFNAQSVQWLRRETAQAIYSSRTDDKIWIDLILCYRDLVFYAPHLLEKKDLERIHALLSQPNGEFQPAFNVCLSLVEAMAYSVPHLLSEELLSFMTAPHLLAVPSRRASICKTLYILSRIRPEVTPFPLVGRILGGSLQLKDMAPFILAGRALVHAIGCFSVNQIVNLLQNLVFPASPEPEFRSEYDFLLERIFNRRPEIRDELKKFGWTSFPEVFEPALAPPAHGTPASGLELEVTDDYRPLERQALRQAMDQARAGQAGPDYVADQWLHIQMTDLTRIHPEVKLETMTEIEFLSDPACLDRSFARRVGTAIRARGNYPGELRFYRLTFPYMALANREPEFLNLPFFGGRFDVILNKKMESVRIDPQGALVTVTIPCFVWQQEAVRQELDPDMEFRYVPRSVDLDQIETNIRVNRQVVELRAQAQRWGDIAGSPFVSAVFSALHDGYYHAIDRTAHRKTPYFNTVRVLYDIASEIRPSHPGVDEMRRKIVDAEKHALSIRDDRDFFKKAWSSIHVYYTGYFGVDRPPASVTWALADTTAYLNNLKRNRFPDLGVDFFGEPHDLQQATVPSLIAYRSFIRDFFGKLRIRTGQDKALENFLYSLTELEGEITEFLGDG